MAKAEIIIGECGGGGACGVVSGTITSTTKHVVLGFKPKVVMLSYTYAAGSNRCFTSYYDEETSPNSFTRWENNSGTTTSINLPNSTLVGIESINNDGFDINIDGGTFQNAYYVAY